MSRVAANLVKLGLVIPEAPAPVANYVPFVITGNLVHISGQISKKVDGSLITGPVHDTGAVEGSVNVAVAEEAARTSIINFIAQVKNACNGNLDRVVKVVRINVFVHSHNSFTKQPVVANAASDILVGVFGEEAGRHARSAVGVAQLPMGVSVEIDGIVEIAPAAGL